MSGSSHINFTVAGLVALGGLMGYAKAKSVPSLVGGLAFGALFAYSGSVPPSPPPSSSSSSSHD